MKTIIKNRIFGFFVFIEIFVVIIPLAFIFENHSLNNTVTYFSYVSGFVAVFLLALKFLIGPLVEN